MRLKIITHEKIVFDEEVDEIYTKGVDGEFGILKNHVPYMSALDIGVTKVVQGKKIEKFATMGGVFQFKDDEAQILTPTAEHSDDIDELRAKDSLKKAQAELAEAEAEADAKRAEAAIARAMARLKAKMNE